MVAFSSPVESVESAEPTSLNIKPFRVLLFLLAFPFALDDHGSFAWSFDARQDAWPAWPLPFGHKGPHVDADAFRVLFAEEMWAPLVLGGDRLLLHRHRRKLIHPK